MNRLKLYVFNEYVLVFLFCLAVIHGPAFSLMDNFDQASCIDCKTYLGLAELDLDQSPVRRYRPIVPMLAGGLNYIFGGVFAAIKPLSFPANFPLSLSFYIVNCILMSFWGVVIYRFSKLYGLKPLFAIGGLLVMLSCRWTPYIAGTPIVDSLYCLITGMALLGIKEKNEKMILLSILIGPFAKEAFIFIAPVIFIFSHVPKWKQILYFAISGILVFAFRYLYDSYAGMPVVSGLEADLSHISTIKDNAIALFSFHGLYDVFSNIGLWVLFPVVAVLFAGYKQALKENTEWYMLFFLVVVLIHMLLSGSLERMFYLAMPLICMFSALSFQEIYRKIAEIKK